MFGFEQGHSWRAGRFFGIPTHLHWSLVLMCAVQLAQWLFYAGLPRGLIGVPIELLIILSIYLHELAHSLVARSFGMRTLEIVVHAFGGFARYTGEPTNRQAMAISAAGPVSNIALWLIFRWAEQVCSSSEWIWPAYAFGSVAGFNLMLGLFNLVPAYPLDGGNVLLHFLRDRAPYAQANWLAFKIGTVVAIPLGLFGLLANQLVLALIFWFVYQACSERLASVGHVGGYDYWRARWTRLREKRPSNVIPINIDWKKYQPGARNQNPPDDDPPVIH